MLVFFLYKQLIPQYHSQNYSQNYSFLEFWVNVPRVPGKHASGIGQANISYTHIDKTVYLCYNGYEDK